MGGYGSTRWDCHTKKETVEDCLQLSIFSFKRDGLLKPDTQRAGRWVWKNSFTGKTRATINYQMQTGAKIPRLHLSYRVTRYGGKEGQDVDYWVLLHKMPCHFGGVRWWFVCPLLINGRCCGRRVGKLYLPSGGVYFGCRHCYDLTYRSSQENDKRINALKKLGAMAVLAQMNSGEIDLIQGLKALPKDVWQR